jgi:hypothetical protein
VSFWCQASTAEEKELHVRACIYIFSNNSYRSVMIARPRTLRSKLVHNAGLFVPAMIKPGLPKENTPVTMGSTLNASLRHQMCTRAIQNHIMPYVTLD